MQRSSELATGAMLVLTAAMGPLPLSPENLTHSVMAELAEDVKARLESAQDAVEGSQQQAMLRPFSTGTASSTSDGPPPSGTPRPYSADPMNLNSTNFSEAGESLGCSLLAAAISVDEQ